jgi:1,4-alpha-glucan branching enzyme
MKKKDFVLVLHMHLPYVVNHGTWPHGMDWLFEAAAETYIPLIQMLDSLYRDNIPVSMTVNITPILLEQFNMNEFKEGFKDYLSNKIKNAIDDGIYFQKTKQTNLAELACFWENFYKATYDYFENIDEDLIKRFKGIQEREQIEIITCAATHGYFPLLGNDEAIRGQVGTAVETYKKYFGKKPKGIWLPENAYRPAYKWISPFGGKTVNRKGIEEILSEFGIRYFFIDTKLIKNSKARGVYLDRFKGLQILWKQFRKQYTSEDLKKELSEHSTYLVYEHDKNPVYSLVRDEKTGSQVWSAKHGYPGDANYLEFHKKKFPGGHKYWRVTGSGISLGDKLEYDPDKALNMVNMHADHFLSLLESIAKGLNNKNETGIVALYDAELFGHWWFEGVKWIELLFRKLYNNPYIDPTKGYEHIKKRPIVGHVSLPEGSWGQGGFHYIWLNDWTKWTWKYIYKAENSFKKFIKNRDQNDKLGNKILEQMARELLLLESSDWQFLISTWSARDYAEDRVTFHWDNFEALAAKYIDYKSTKKWEKADENLLSHLEKVDNVFSKIDLDNWG